MPEPQRLRIVAVLERHLAVLKRPCNCRAEQRDRERPPTKSFLICSSIFAHSCAEKSRWTAVGLNVQAKNFPCQKPSPSWGYVIARQDMIMDHEGLSHQFVGDGTDPLGD
jgi:hypothetical protein